MQDPAGLRERKIRSYRKYNISGFFCVYRGSNAREFVVRSPTRLHQPGVSFLVAVKVADVDVTVAIGY